MAAVKSSLRRLTSCLRCLRHPPSAHCSINVAGLRLLSSSTAARQEVQQHVSPQSSTDTMPDFMKNWGPLDPNMVENKRDERRLIRREGIQPVGSRRRRAALRRSAFRNAVEIPFEQLPYQCFQEARKFLLEDRQKKLEQIKTQRERINKLLAQDAAASGGPAAKEARLRSMRNYLNELIILVDINDPMVKKKFEDGLGDMNKPIYRYLADQKWRKYKRLVLQQRLTQMNIVPDLLPVLDPVADVDLGFGRKTVPPGEFVDSAISENMPRLTVQSFEPGEKLVSVVVVDADVPVPEKDRFTYRCHFIASNITISPTQTSIPLIRMEQEDRKADNPAATRIALPWLAPWAHKGAPYHRMAVFVLEQSDAKTLDVAKLAATKRDGFVLRSFVDKHALRPIGATLFRTKWDPSMPGVMRRAGLEKEIDVEFKRKRVEPLPYKKRTERMR